MVVFYLILDPHFFSTVGRTLSAKSKRRSLQEGGLYVRPPVLCVPPKHEVFALQHANELRIALQNDSRSILYTWKEVHTCHLSSNIFQESVLVWEEGMFLNRRNDLNVLLLGTFKSSTGVTCFILLFACVLSQLAILLFCKQIKLSSDLPSSCTSYLKRKTLVQME
ncbi:hypothetical protein CEXT_461471 [Caerostris extrusa]|uniref:Uncharacterized protein n=1 Tax=Caerostris extrusa TaxID=172846 RepID=A0AAV4Q754_CAEEX|nr:hypothetical protein CEXT_461471 [Caerostris extrusa]